MTLLKTFKEPAAVRVLQKWPEKWWRSSRTKVTLLKTLKEPAAVRVLLEWPGKCSES